MMLWDLKKASDRVKDLLLGCQEAQAFANVADSSKSHYTPPRPLPNPNMNTLRRARHPAAHERLPTDRLVLYVVSCGVSSSSVT